MTPVPTQVCEKLELTSDALFEDDPAASQLYREEFLMLEKAAVGYPVSGNRCLDAFHGLNLNNASSQNK